MSYNADSIINQLYDLPTVVNVRDNNIPLAQ